MSDELWTAMADPTRRELLERLLLDGEATATALAAQMPITRQGVAKHLAVLQRAGLVHTGRAGREVRYAIDPARLETATSRLVEIATQWEARLTAIKRLAEE